MVEQEAVEQEAVEQEAVEQEVVEQEVVEQEAVEQEMVEQEVVEMERLSALMDDELDQHAIDGELDRIKGDPQREEAWAIYHVIGDALRGQIDPVRGISERVRTMLANEPTVLAPRSWKSNRVTQRVVLPLAASVCGIAVVAWLALSSNSAISPANDPVNNPVNSSVSPDVLATAGQVVQQPYTSIAEGSDASGNESNAAESNSSESNGSAADDMSEYLMAHQQFSPSTAMQGVVPYVRTVSSGDGAR